MKKLAAVLLILAMAVLLGCPGTPRNYKSKSSGTDTEQKEESSGHAR